jgi:outer membrane receptor for Fe3+-dicitrate
LGLEWALTGPLAIVFEATDQFATITGFSGTGTYLDSAAAGTVTEQGKLYAFNSQTSNQTSYPVVFIRNKVPAEAGVVNVREATVDFSGISIRAGLRIKF